MLNNYMFRLFIFIALTASLLACQATPQRTPGPEPVVESKIQPEQIQQVQQKTAEPDPQQVLYQQAMKSTRAGEIDNAIEQFTRVVKTNPSAKHAFTNLGLLYIHKKQNREAKVAFLNAIEQNKNDAIAYNHLAVIQRQQGEFKLSLFNYYKAINADPDYANAHLNLGILLDIYLQDLPLALEQYEIFQKLTGNNNQQVEKWVIDIKRRIAADKGK